ncbi:hypothetical protein [Roseisalinus antarcticus]|uniref:ABM domain-containing protein n=1 Tax=Roseisalinus antarcticus TaxID=254357 RepID=A0A1Y5T4G2_9RHOB|nr:hypothetical protein [Roseisalinus antarcticus]SLN52111.1 hypothetical protein ROA7023_02299 [Roseisalinus antarcticus]
MSKTFEIVTFRLKEGVTHEEFNKETMSMERNFLGKLHGFADRDTGISDDGEVAVVLHWDSAEDAQSSIDKFVDAEDTKSFTAMIDMETFKMRRFSLTDHYDLVSG